MGVNRISMGIQDFDHTVQMNINRVQPTWLIKDLLTPNIRNLFSSINFDIICGLPGQTKNSFKNTIQQVIDFSPDRIMIMFLSVTPQVKKMLKHKLPDILKRILLWNEACETLQDNGYIRIGVDHFAKPNDILAKAFKTKIIHWNSLGYGVGKQFSILGLGVSSSSDIKPDYYYQNNYSINDYLKNVSDNRFPIFRGSKLSKDDIIRRDIIHQLRCKFYLNFCSIEDRYGIDFRNYFTMELDMLNNFKHNNMISMGYNSITINEPGKHVFGFIARVFDKYRNMETS